MGAFQSSVLIQKSSKHLLPNHFSTDGDAILSKVAWLNDWYLRDGSLFYYAQGSL